MRCKRLGPPLPTQVVLLARSRPARSIARFRTTLDEARGESAWEDIECARFRLACRCGGGQFRIGVRPPPDTAGLITGSIALDCSTCRVVTDLFDPDRDGYNAEMDLASLDAASPEISDESRGPHFCECQCDVFEIDVVLDYHLEDEELEAPPVALRPQDFFTGFTLGTRCVACGVRSEPAGYECA